jgi:hypothetical protein
MRNTSAKLTSESHACCRMTPLPAMITGHRALEMIRAASSILASGGCRRIGGLHLDRPLFLDFGFGDVLGKVDEAAARLLGLRHLERLS